MICMLFYLHEYEDPRHHSILVRGEDSLSGVEPGFITPSNITPIEWTSNGSDTAEARAYQIFDLAGNVLELVMYVRSERNEFEITIVELVYNWRKALKPQRNTIEFRRVVGCCGEGPLLYVLQRASLGEGVGKGKKRAVTEFVWDALHCETRVARRLEDKESLDEGCKREDGHEQCCKDYEKLCGLVTLCIVTKKDCDGELEVVKGGQVASL